MLFEKQVLNIYKNMICHRCDDDGTAFYYSYKDFVGLHQESYPFTSSLGHKLQGYLYHYDNVIPNRIVIFEHGFGGGHRSYFKEIERLCKEGYLVLAYDHTGCMESEGDNIRGMSQSLCDLNDCINHIKQDERFLNYDISVIGHSWGGYSTLNISALHKDISHIVVLSGFVSVKLLVKSFFGGLLAPYCKAVINFERTLNPNTVDLDGVETLKNTNSKVLLIYSSSDQVIKKKLHYDYLYKNLSSRSNIEFLLVDNKGHNPNYTVEAVRLLGEYSKTKSKYGKKKLLVSEEQKKEFLKLFDFDKMTKQDESVWSKIFEFLK